MSGRARDACRAGTLASIRDTKRFGGGGAAPVRDAVAAYRNDDGGFGHALEPDSLARGLFDGAPIKAHLDHLAQAQRDDGGWTFNWLAWSPAAEREWRGFLTVDALRVVRANGRW